MVGLCLVLLFSFLTSLFFFFLLGFTNVSTIELESSCLPRVCSKESVRRFRGFFREDVCKCKILLIHARFAEEGHGTRGCAPASSRAALPNIPTNTERRCIVRRVSRARRKMRRATVNFLSTSVQCSLRKKDGILKRVSLKNKPLEPIHPQRCEPR